MTATITPYRSAIQPGKDNFWHLLLAEWTKFRTLRGWLIAVVAAIGLMILLPIAISGTANNPVEACTSQGCQAEGEVIAIGPGDQAVTDQFYFVHQPLTSSGSITALVSAPRGLSMATHLPPGFPVPPATQPWAKAGLIIKASTKPGSAYAAVMLTAGHGVRMQYDFSHDQAGPGGGPTPLWLRLTRSGDRVTSYDSTDGTHWTMLGTATLAGLPATAQVGMFVASPYYNEASAGSGGDDSIGGPTVAAARFSHVALTGGAAGATWTGAAVGRTTLPACPRNMNCEAKPQHVGGPQERFVRTGSSYRVQGSGDIAPFAAIVDPVQVSLYGVLFGLIALLAVGALYLTGEYRRAMIRTSFTASPRRGRVLAAKAIVIGSVSFVAGLIGAAITFPIVERRLNAAGWVPPVWHEWSLTSAIGLQVVIGTAALIAMTSVLALAFGAITRRSISAVAAVIGLVIVPLILALVLPLGPAKWLTSLTPAAAFGLQRAMPRYTQVTATCSPYHGCFSLAPWAGFAVMCAWTAAALGLALFLIRRRDA
jgi:ABC-2 family transporter protein